MYPESRVNHNPYGRHALVAPCIDYVIVFAALACAAHEKLLAPAPLLVIAQLLLLPVYLWAFAAPAAVGVIEVAPPSRRPLCSSPYRWSPLQSHNGLHLAPGCSCRNNAKRSIGGPGGFACEQPRGLCCERRFDLNLVPAGLEGLDGVEITAPAGGEVGQQVQHRAPHRARND